MTSVICRSSGVTMICGIAFIGADFFRADFVLGNRAAQPMLIRLALPPAAVVLTLTETSSTSQSRL